MDHVSLFFFGPPFTVRSQIQNGPLPSGHAEGIPLHFADASMGHGRRDRAGRPRRQRLQLTVGARDEFLGDRSGQNSLAVSEVSDIVTHVAEIARRRCNRSGEVRFAPKSGHSQLGRLLPLGAMSGNESLATLGDASIRRQIYSPAANPR